METDLNTKEAIILQMRKLADIHNKLETASKSKVIVMEHFQEKDYCLSSNQ